jgi:type IV pilus assembly protein PilO
VNTRHSPLKDAFLDDEKTFLNRGVIDLLALSSDSIFLKFTVFFLVAALTFSAMWVLWLNVSWRDLQQTHLEEIKLKDVVALKLVKAAQLEPLKQQQLQILRAIESGEFALSRKVEIASLLKDINRAGLSRGLKFELFRPEKEVISAHYAELPISLRVTGHYHQLGFFAADVAHMPRLVTLDNLFMTPLPEGNLTLEATLHTYRHLEAEERPVLKKSNPDPGGKP